MTSQTREIRFDGGILQRGFWLYVWEITPRHGEALYYVGRTGDSSSTNAQSPFNRMGQHLGFNKRANVLRRHLSANETNVDPRECSFRLVAHGPMLEEVADPELYWSRRDIVAGLEKALEVAMRGAGYKVINTVRCLKRMDVELFANVRAEFASHFPLLASRDTLGKGTR